MLRKNNSEVTRTLRQRRAWLSAWQRRITDARESLQSGSNLDEPAQELENQLDRALGAVLRLQRRESRKKRTRLDENLTSLEVVWQKLKHAELGAAPA